MIAPTDEAPIAPMNPQSGEQAFRDTIAEAQLDRASADIWTAIGAHHCLAVMREHARRFRSRFSKNEWILDVGVGWGWHWAKVAGRSSNSGTRILGLDMSFQSLRVAKRLLKDIPNVYLVCGTSAALPFRSDFISGVWSVQTFQHFPSVVLDQSISELDRVLKDTYWLEIHNLYPSFLYRLAYRLAGRDVRSWTGPVFFARRPIREWEAIWRRLRNGRVKFGHGFSELFFHPEFRFRPTHYPVALEGFVRRYLPWLAAIFARQASVTVSNAAGARHDGIR